MRGAGRPQWPPAPSGSSADPAPGKCLEMESTLEVDHLLVTKEPSATRYLQKEAISLGDSEEELEGRDDGRSSRDLPRLVPELHVRNRLSRHWNKPRCDPSGGTSAFTTIRSVRSVGERCPVLPYGFVRELQRLAYSSGFELRERVVQCVANRAARSIDSTEILDGYGASWTKQDGVVVDVGNRDRVQDPAIWQEAVDGGNGRI